MSATKTAAPPQSARAQKAAPRLTQRRLSIAPPHAATERAAQQVAESGPRSFGVSLPRPTAYGSILAPASVQRALASHGRGLNGETLARLEPALRHRFDRVRIHTGTEAAGSAHEIGALAYTLGSDIVFAHGRYAPETADGFALLRHELAHVLMDAPLGAPHVIHRQTPTGSTTTPAARRDYVFIMGEDARRTANPFYGQALHYFRIHFPQATFVTDLRSLSELLTHVSTQITQPIGNLYIVSHANEDGTLSFGLTPGDTDHHLSVGELRTALHPATGTSTLARLTNQVDAQTTVHIKGCDIGRTQQMVELLDEAFGGAGTVTAPTHAQQYGTDPTLADAARQEFRRDVAAAHPIPPAVDSTLRGADRRRAVAARAAAVRQRQQDIRTELQARRAEENQRADEAGAFESFGGPMFQRPGTTIYTDTELRPEVARLYGHLSDTQQRQMVTSLIAPDRRPAAAAERQGVFQQQGQRAYRRVRLRATHQDPRTVAEANRLYGASFRTNHFTASGVTALHPATDSAGTAILQVTVAGTVRESRTRTRPDVIRLSYPADMVRPDPPLIASARETVPNPDRYAWRVARNHATTGITTVTVTAERVVAFLHHGSLDISPHQHFTRPESNRDYFARSTFAPPPPPAGTPAARAPRP